MTDHQHRQDLGLALATCQVLLELSTDLGTSDNGHLGPTSAFLQATRELTLWSQEHLGGEQ